MCDIFEEYICLLNYFYKFLHSHWAGHKKATKMWSHHNRGDKIAQICVKKIPATCQ